MNPPNLAEQLRQAILATPFSPFSVVLTDGSRHPVADRMRIATDGERVVIVRDREGSLRLRMNAVSSIEFPTVAN